MFLQTCLAPPSSPPQHMEMIGEAFNKEMFRYGTKKVIEGEIGRQKFHAHKERQKEEVVVVVGKVVVGVDVNFVCLSVIYKLAKRRSLLGALAGTFELQPFQYTHAVQKKILQKNILNAEQDVYNDLCPF